MSTRPADAKRLLTVRNPFPPVTSRLWVSITWSCQSNLSFYHALLLSNLSLYHHALTVPNQVWTFRLAKLEGVDGVDQVALHKSPVDHTHLVVIVSIECKSFINVWDWLDFPHLHSFPNTESAVLAKWHDITWRVGKGQHCSAVSLSYHCCQ